MGALGCGDAVSCLHMEPKSGACLRAHVDVYPYICGSNSVLNLQPSAASVVQTVLMDGSSIASVHIIYPIGNTFLIKS